MQRLLTTAAALLSLFAFAPAQTNSSTPTAPPQSTASPTQTTQPVHRKAQSFQPGEDPREKNAQVKQAQSTQTAPEFDHVGIEVRDIAKSTDFYQRVVGLTAIADPFNDTQHVFLRLGAHSQLHLVQKAGAAKSTSAADSSAHAKAYADVHLAVRVADVPAFAARLDRMKVPYRDTNDKPHTITKRPDGVNQIYFQDPDGYWIEVNDDKF